MIMLFLLVFLGSALGGVCRFAAAEHVPLRSTLIVNCLGAFLTGLMVTSIIENREEDYEHFTLFAVVGFLGGFTTISAWALETWNLLKSRSYRQAALNGLGTWALCLIAVAGGLALGRVL